jgi:exodeoxyribonuclease VII large subunit
MLETSIDAPAPVRIISESIRDWIGRLGPVWVEGELSQLDDRNGSSMIFMRLKDTSSDISISVSCHRSVFNLAKPLPANARIKIFSKVNFYMGNGSLSLSAKEIYHVGIGELLARLETLKKLLAGEGLFALERKKPLPFLPEKIGLICGRNSAAMKDVIENARRRWPAVKFEIREVAVQGAMAVSEVSNALRDLESDQEVEVIIITRGGGSFEDLLPFSDESLIRLVASLETPIVSAIGHEQDTPLLDLVADFRASTPTDAAKRVVPDIREEIESIGRLRDRIRRSIQSRIDFESAEIKSLSSRPVMRDPVQLILPLIEEISLKARQSLQLISYRLELAATELNEARSQLRALSPAAVLERGYAVVQNCDGEVIRKSDQVEIDEELAVRLSDGKLKVSVRSRF